jgi:myosin-5
MSQTYDVGTRAWQPDPTEGWVASEVISKTIDGDKVKLEFQLDSGEVRFAASVQLCACQR